MAVCFAVALLYIGAMRRLHARPAAPVPALLILVLGLIPGGGASAADQVDPAVLDAFNAVVRDVGQLPESEADKAIELYERALLDGPARGFGRLHLRIAHLHRVADRSAEAAHHFKACLSDERVDPIDRQFICERGFEQVTAPLTVEGLPEGGTVTVIEPALFAGAHQSGARLPRGEVLLVVDAPGRRAERTVVAVDGPTLWTARLGLEEPAGPLVPEGFVAGDVPAPASDALPQWPGYAAGGLGILLVGTGVAVGIENQDTLAGIRDRQSRGRCGVDVCAGDLESAASRAALADGLWISGAVLAAGGIAWWLISGEAPVLEVAK